MTTLLRPKVEMVLVDDVRALNPTAWYRADVLGLADGANVLRWPDSSGNGRDLDTVGGTAPTFAQRGIGRRSAVVFDGGWLSRSLSTAGDLMGSTGTAYAVFRSNNSGTGVVWSNAGRNMFTIGTTYYTGFYDGAPAYASRPFVLGRWQTALWLYSKDDATGVGYAGSGDLDTASLGAVSSDPDPSLMNPTTFRVGSNTAGHLDGAIAELIFFAETHNEETRRQVARYLRQKYPEAYDATSDPAAALPWVDVSEDVVSDVVCSWGIHGWQPKDRVADPGNAAFDLDNNSTNSAATVGYYTIGHPAVRTGFATGTPVRVSVVHEFYGTRVLWVGTVDVADPGVGVKDPRTRVRCVDWMDDAARAKLSGVPVQTNVQSDVLFTTIVASLDKQPPGGVSAGSGSDVYPYALDNTQDESSKVIGEFQKLAQSEFGMVYVSRGVLNFDGRRRRSGAGVSLYTFNELSLTGLSLTNGRDDVLNRVQVAVHPRRVDVGPTVLFKLADSVQILRGTSITISCPYRDQNQQSQRIGGKDMVEPVAGTDYSFRPNADGSGANLDGQLTVTPSFGGNSASLTITNNGPLDGYIPAQGLQLRGTGLYDFEPVISDQKDQASIDLVGENPIAYDMPYQSSVDNALDMASFILSLNKDAILRPKTISWVANWDETLVQLLYSINISSLVSVTSARMGLDAVRCYVNGFNVTVARNGVVRVTNDLAQADTTAFWTLEVDGRTELDETTVLGYGLFVAGWILDQSTLGTDTFLA